MITKEPGTIYVTTHGYRFTSFDDAKKSILRAELRKIMHKAEHSSLNPDFLALVIEDNYEELATLFRALDQLKP